MKTTPSCSQLPRLKITLIAIAILSLLTGSARAQWTSQTSGTTQFLRDVGFSDENHGWAIGSSAAVVKTSNGGATWTAATGTVPQVIGGGTFEGWGL